MTDRYAVIGNPIKHSKSPEIHTAFALQTGEDISYSRLLGHESRFADDVRSFAASGGMGMNVTVPFKELAFEFAPDRTARARMAGAANTLLFRSGQPALADNTDGAGLINDLRVNHQINLRGASVLLLGAGGAARGVMGPLLDEQPASLCIANRTEEKAQELAHRFQHMGTVQAEGFGEIRSSYDIIINATAASLSGEVPPIPDTVLSEGGVTYDMMYASEPTAFVLWGRAHSARLALDGLGMLVEQAAESFALWRGIRPETGPVIKALQARPSAR